MAKGLIRDFGNPNPQNWDRMGLRVYQRAEGSGFRVPGRGWMRLGIRSFRV